MKQTPTSSAWHRQWFDQDYLVLYGHRDPEEAARFVDRLAAAGWLPPPKSREPVLDLACGAGRHSHALAARGHRVVGLDWSLPLLERAVRGSDGAGPPCFVRGDLGRLPLRRGAGLVLSLFTSLGYSDHDEENLRVWRGVLGLPRPGGRLVVDFLNPAHVEATLVATSTRQVGDWDVRETRRLLPATCQVEKTVLFGPSGQPPRQVVERVKLYGPEWFHEPALAAGFRRLDHWGDLAGTPFQVDSPRSVQIWEAPR